MPRRVVGRVRGMNAAANPNPTAPAGHHEWCGVSGISRALRAAAAPHAWRALRA